MNVQLRELSSVSPNLCVSQASYWMPDLMVDLEHAPFGFWVVEALRPRMIVELGVHGGFSYSAFCQAVERLQLPARCFAIDTWRGDEHAGYYGDDVYDAVCSHNRRYNSFSRLIRSEFSDACSAFADGSIDLLHIDGCHRYEAVRHDFEIWLPKLSKRGVVLFHDTAEYAEGFGVHRLWEELPRAIRPLSSGTAMGWRARRRREASVALRDFFDVSASLASAQTIRATYERLGSAAQPARTRGTAQAGAPSRNAGRKLRDQQFMAPHRAIAQRRPHDDVREQDRGRPVRQGS